MREATLAEAADLLGLTREGVRQRLMRGRLEGRKGNDGIWTVYLPDDVQELPKLANELAVTQARLEGAERLVTSLQSEVQDLRGQRDRADAALAALQIRCNRLLDELALARQPFWQKLASYWRDR